MGLLYSGMTRACYIVRPEREREVLLLIAEGKSNQEIAEQLHISGKTVSNHISNIFNNLQVTDRAQAIVKARRLRDVVELFVPILANVRNLREDDSSVTLLFG